MPGDGECRNRGPTVKHTTLVRRNPMENRHNVMRDAHAAGYEFGYENGYADGHAAARDFYEEHVANTEEAAQRSRIVARRVAGRRIQEERQRVPDNRPEPVALEAAEQRLAAPDNVHRPGMFHADNDCGPSAEYIRPDADNPAGQLRVYGYICGPDDDAAPEEHDDGLSLIHI